MKALSCGLRQQCMHPRQKWGHNTRLIFLCCFLAVVFGCYFLLPGRSVLSGSAIDSNQQSNISAKTSHQIMPTRYPLHAVMRDPFAIPKEFQPETVDSGTLPAATYFSPAPQPVLSSALPDSSLKLIGVVSGGGQQVAIIKTGNVSRSYQLEEYIGLYQLISVGESAAMLRGPHGQKVLVLER